MISNDIDCLDEASIVFNAEFIRQKKIKSIRGRVSIKKAGQPMRTTKHYTQYFFNDKGKVTSSIVHNDFGLPIWRKYFYNDKGYMIYQSVGDAWRIDYSTYLFNDSAQVVAQDDFVRQEDKMGIPFTREVMNQSYIYTKSDSSRIKTIKNHAGTPYKKNESFFNSKGQLSRREDRYLATNEGSITYFEYDDNGKVTLQNKLSSRQKVEIQKDQFTYDELGNLKEKKHFEKGVLSLETQYIVNQESGLLSAVIEQKGGLTTLKIIRFQTYEYYD